MVSTIELLIVEVILRHHRRFRGGSDASKIVRLDRVPVEQARVFERLDIWQIAKRLHAED